MILLQWKTIAVGPSTWIFQRTIPTELRNHIALLGQNALVHATESWSTAWCNKCSNSTNSHLPTKWAPIQPPDIMCRSIWVHAQLPRIGNMTLENNWTKHTKMYSLKATAGGTLFGPPRQPTGCKEPRWNLTTVSFWWMKHDNYLRMHLYKSSQPLEHSKGAALERCQSVHNSSSHPV